MLSTHRWLGIFAILSLCLSGSLLAQEDQPQIVFTGCPPYVEGNHCDSMYFGLVAVDMKTGRPVPGIKYFLVSGPGSVDEKTGLWVFHPEDEDLPPYYSDIVEVGAYHGDDQTEVDDYCRFDVRVYDHRPLFEGYCGAHITVLPGEMTTIPVEITETDWCDEPQFDSATITPEPNGSFAFDADSWTVSFEPGLADEDSTFEVIVFVTSGPARTVCRFWLDVFQPEPAKFHIASVDKTDPQPGDTVLVDLNLDESSVDFDRVDLTIAFDATTLQLIGIEPGPEFFSETTGCGWDWFDWSGPGHCVTGGPTLVRLTARAVTSYGAPDPSCLIPNSLPATFATMIFVITDNLGPGEQFAPVSFYWCDCRENYLVSTLPRGRSSVGYFASAAYSPEGGLISPDPVPGYSGASDVCYYYQLGSAERYRLVEFHNGGVHMTVTPPEATYTVRIGYQYEVLLGQYVDVPITLEEFDHSEGLGGFDFLIGYHASALAFQMANEGALYDSCSWEYFTYRFDPHSGCGDACPSGMIRLVGLAETNNGPYHPNPDCADDNPGWVPSVPVALTSMRFLVSNDRTLECQVLPIRFFWYDCSDNALTNHDGSKLYLSANVHDYGDVPITGVEDFPTYRGAQQECLSGNPYVTRRAVDFYNGSLHISCTGTVPVRGDINLNGIAYEIADAVMFSDYFTQGFAAFGSHVEGSTAASDVNVDGKPLTIEDFVYMVRVVVGDLVPNADPSPNPATFIWNPQSGAVEVSTIDELGGIYLIVESEITPELLADQMEMKYGWDTGWTKILIYSFEAGAAVTTGPVVSVAGASGIVSVEAATYDARPVVTSVEISDGTTMAVSAEIRGDVLPGVDVDVAITLDGLVPPLGGFDFLLGYPSAFIELVSVTPGPPLFEDCEWEYFTYQSVDGCGAGCPDKLVRMVGVAETNNGPYHPSCYAPANLPATLATLNFHGDANAECGFVPVRFFWQDCTDNLIAGLDALELYASRLVVDAGGYLIPREASLPSYGGTPDGCLTPVPGSSSTILRRIDFNNGGVNFLCDSNIDNRGDINLNGYAFEIGDAVMFSDYFVEGLAAFGPHVEGSTAASDVNADGFPLSVPDLVFLIRVMTGEADPDNPPPQTPSPNRTHLHWQPENDLTWVDMPDSLGAMYMVVVGEITPTLLAGNMEMKFGWDSGQTNILVYSLDPGKAIRTGLLVSIPGALGIVRAETAAYNGRRVNLVIMDGTTDIDDDLFGILPGDYALYPNYPNPFNPSTTVRYDLPEQAQVEIAIYNIAGQRVRTLVSGTQSAGRQEVVWDGCDDSGSRVSSGVYLYRMSAGDFVRSRKMMLLK